MSCFRIQLLNQWSEVEYSWDIVTEKTQEELEIFCKELTEEINMNTGCYLRLSKLKFETELPTLEFIKNILYY